jgi:hypothetical protein
MEYRPEVPFPQHREIWELVQSFPRAIRRDWRRAAYKGIISGAASGAPTM